MITKSLYGSGRIYAVGQIRVRSDGLHIQIGGNEGNRAYGYAESVSLANIKGVGEEIVEWLKMEAAKQGLPSLAESNAVYAKAQFAPRDGMVHVQIPGAALNRLYGAAFDFEDPALYKWLEKQIEADTTEKPEEPVSDNEADDTPAKELKEGFVVKVAEDGDKVQIIIVFSKGVA